MDPVRKQHSSSCKLKNIETVTAENNSKIFKLE